MTLWERGIAVAGPGVILLGMWIVHVQTQAVDNDRIQLILMDLKQIRGELIEIERKLPR